MEELLARDWRKFVIIAGISLLTFPTISKASTNHPLLDGQLPSINYQQYAAKSFVFNPRSLQWKALNNGKVVRAGRASGGRHYCPDVKRGCRTPSGSYHVISKGSASCRSSRYPLGRGGAPMPYCMFFSKNYAIHGSPDVPNYNASHGCIRVRPGDARWLNQNFMNIGTSVIVKPY